MKSEKSCGVVVYKRKAGRLLFLLLKHCSGNHWSLAKGHVEIGESEETTARRELFEETGLVADIKEGFRDVLTYEPRPGVSKEVVYFLGKAKKWSVVLQESEILNSVWLELEDALKLVTHPGTGLLLQRAAVFINARKGKNNIVV